MTKKLFFYILSFGIFFACNENEKEAADLLVINANVYTVDDAFSTAEAFVVKDGKFVAVGTSAELQEKYNAAEVYDAEGKTILPGLIDAHAHFYGLGTNMQAVDLTGTTSF